MTGLLIVYYAWENKRRDSLAVEHRENNEFLDLTDRENLEFRVGSIVLANYWALLINF